VNVALWATQGLLALAFAASGSMKLVLAREALSAKLGWVESAPTWLPQFVGVMEILGAVGLILPLATHIAPRLTPLAALLLAVVMLLAVFLHLARQELSQVIPAGLLLCLCAFVAIGRFIVLARDSASGP
jgi:uncharacterized membrane protein YphA (DoxX/SURF4 family)